MGIFSGNHAHRPDPGETWPEFRIVKHDELALGFLHSICVVMDRVRPA